MRTPLDMAEQILDQLEAMGYLRCVRRQLRATSLMRVPPAACIMLRAPVPNTHQRTRAKKLCLLAGTLASPPLLLRLPSSASSATACWTTPCCETPCAALPAERDDLTHQTRPPDTTLPPDLYFLSLHQNPSMSRVWPPAAACFCIDTTACGTLL